MKKNYFLSFILTLSTLLTYAQTQCLGGRFAFDVFTTITTTSNIVYGSNINSNGGVQSLTLDVYEPAGDTMAARPLIVWAHAGSFIGGTKTDADMVKLCQSFAKKGFVCASINYRVGITPIDSTGAMKALLRAVQDLKASVRFFYKDRLTSNTYKIDTNQVFIAGSSAGAITALHMAYLDKSCEVNDYIAQPELEAMGGIDGYSGNECYSSKIKGVINLCGALGRYGWIEQGDVPLCSMHGTSDNTVKYGRGQAVVITFPVIYLDGSRMLFDRTQSVGVPHRFYSWYGKNHVPYTSSTLYMDSTINFVRDFLVSTMGCSETPFINPNAAFGSVNLYPMNPCSTNISMNCSPTGINTFTPTKNWKIYPNPASDKLTFTLQELKSDCKIEIFDITGKIIYQKTIQEETTEITTKNFAPGIYFLKINQDNVLHTQKIIFE
jgi:hypothetical protein